MNNVVNYKGYQAVIEFSAADQTLFGKVVNIDDKIVFEIDNPCNTMSIFKEAIEDYLAFCQENSKEPCKPHNNDDINS